MINRELIDPKSIVVVGGSNNVHKPGGRLVRNLLDGKYKGELYVVNARGRRRARSEIVSFRAGYSGYGNGYHIDSRSFMSRSC